jgi:hypothetical protein
MHERCCGKIASLARGNRDRQISASVELVGNVRGIAKPAVNVATFPKAWRGVVIPVPIGNLQK